MPRKRKILPKDFEAQLASGDLPRLKAVFDLCELDARGGLTKETALAFSDCSDDLALWLIERGANLAAEDRYGETPLHARAGNVRGRLAILLSLGANVAHGEGSLRGTPLHRAAGAFIPENAKLLLAAGAPIDARDREGLTALELALRRCSNTMLERMAELANVLLAAGAGMTSGMRESISRIGTTFEFYRTSYNTEEIEVASAALDRLYVLFDVHPVPRRTMHESKVLIMLVTGTWEERFRDLWDRLVPATGAAATVQGEVIRIAGRITREIDGNGGINWDAQYRVMADAWLGHVGRGVPLPPDALAEAGQRVADAKARRGDLSQMCELAVAWIALNPQPVTLARPAYER